MSWNKTAIFFGPYDGQTCALMFGREHSWSTRRVAELDSAVRSFSNGATGRFIRAVLFVQLTVLSSRLLLRDQTSLPVLRLRGQTVEDNTAYTASFRLHGVSPSPFGRSTCLECAIFSSVPSVRGGRRSPRYHARCGAHLDRHRRRGRRRPLADRIRGRVSCPWRLSSPLSAQRRGD